jgi:hypothetical protein
MHYQISRNGQEYGPYTLEDLQRYLASGNVLPTDLAKGDTMTEWVTVSALLASASPSGGATPGSQPAAGSAAAYTNVGTVTGSAAGGYSGFDYGTPGYAAANPNVLAASPYPDAPNLHWGLYLLFAVLTCGWFSKVFTVVQAVWMKKVQPNSIALWFYIGAYVLAFINAYRSKAVMLAVLSHHYDPMQNRGGGLTLLYWALIIASRFMMKSSLEEHFNGPEPIGLRLSGVMTFFFGGVYFQAKLNEINAAKSAARYGAGGAIRPY